MWSWLTGNKSSQNVAKISQKMKITASIYVILSRVITATTCSSIHLCSTAKDIRSVNVIHCYQQNHFSSHPYRVISEKRKMCKSQKTKQVANVYHYLDSACFYLKLLLIKPEKSLKNWCQEYSFNCHVIKTISLTLTVILTVFTMSGLWHSA